MTVIAQLKMNTINVRVAFEFGLASLIWPTPGDRLYLLEIITTILFRKTLIIYSAIVALNLLLCHASVGIHLTTAGLRSKPKTQHIDDNHF